MAFITIAFPKGKVARPRCECCRETKPEPNQKRVCDTCDEVGCEREPCGDYKSGVGCPLMIKRKKNAARCQATAAWKAGGR